MDIAVFNHQSDFLSQQGIPRLFRVQISCVSQGRHLKASMHTAVTVYAQIGHPHPAAVPLQQIRLCEICFHSFELLQWVDDLSALPFQIDQSIDYAIDLLHIVEPEIVIFIPIGVAVYGWPQWVKYDAVEPWLVCIRYEIFKLVHVDTVYHGSDADCKDALEVGFDEMIDRGHGLLVHTIESAYVIMDIGSNAVKGYVDIAKTGSNNFSCELRVNQSAIADDPREHVLFGGISNDVKNVLTDKHFSTSYLCAVGTYPATQRKNYSFPVCI